VSAHESAKGTEGGLLAGDRRQGVQQVAGRAGQPVESRHGHHVARGERVEQPAKLGAVGLHPARHFPKHLHASGGGELPRLRVNALAVGRDSCIPVNHEVIMHRISAPEKGLVFRRLVLVRNS